MNIMFFSSTNTAEFQQFFAAFMIPVFTPRWVKRYKSIPRYNSSEDALG
jgi:hypothetical protein